MNADLTAPKQSEGPPPDRRPNSLRRTSSFRTHWPGAIDEPMVAIGRARDLYTGDDPASPSVLGEESVEAVFTLHRELQSITSSRRNELVSQLAGLNPGGPLRKAVAAMMPEEVSGTTLLHRLLDDIPGVSFISPTGWTSWTPDWIDKFREVLGKENRFDVDVTGVCAGFRPGSKALKSDGFTEFSTQSRGIDVPPIRMDDDYAWHELDRRGGPHHWRLRRTDIWIEGGQAQVDVWFQDSGALPEGRRQIVHEYRVKAVVDPTSFELVSINVHPAVLPYWECRAASPNAERLIGMSVAKFGRAVAVTLAGSVGCTHLNEVLRALQDVESMTRTLQQHSVEHV